MFLIWFSQVTQMVYDSSPRHMIKLPSKFHPTSKKAYMELKVGMKKRWHTYLHLLRSQIWILEEKCHTTRSRCARVWYFWWSRLLLYLLRSLFELSIETRLALSFSFFSHGL